jgi:hypothetical protein
MLNLRLSLIDPGLPCWKGDYSEVDGCSLIAKLSIGFNLGRASVSLALNPPIYFMLAPVIRL